MGISLQWDKEDKAIIRWEFEGRWTASDLLNAFDTTSALAHDAARVVYGLGVLRGTPPPDMLGITQKTIEYWPENLGGLVFIGASGLMESSFSMLKKIYRDATPKIRFVSSLEEAYDIITSMRFKDEYARKV
jgi:hypothetical protein